ncbi:MULTISPECIES: allophanate hydrolase [unclassified Vibrio]|uniref:Allophanate hydrolase n=1 Tax=Vibrio sp. HB236076 TaxID=3232307 RepID=A0AB39H9B5_9VIBR|nr:allophanate hydrolase [Vibrio sp. HB161653]MDP5254136.1 allophanate hydrolase [Vibrio sp. HB161653]
MNSPQTMEALISAYQTKALTVSGYLQQQLALAREDDHNTWLSLLSDEQLQGYIDALEQQDPQSLPLYGVPFAIKDNIDLAGLETTAGCEAYRYHPQESAFVVQQLINAGAVPLGKTNLDQFATGLVGVRSPWGAGKNSFDPEYISGGSSSGSAISVARGQVFFSLGTDTAGSGRVPAAFNNLIGVKPSKGLFSNSGVVPACRTLDCVTIFARTVEDAKRVFSVANCFDASDCYARAYQEQSLPSDWSQVKVGIPHQEQLAFFGNSEYQQQYQQAVQRLEQLGATLVPFDLQPFLDAATLLYQGPWVAERYVAIQSFFEQDPKACLPVIETIIGGAKHYSAADTFAAMYKLQKYKSACDKALSQVDLVMTPTAGTTYTIAELEDNPIELNSNLGYYTNFMNLLDYAAIALPSSLGPSGRPFGVTFFAPAMTDLGLLSLGQQWTQHLDLPLGATGKKAVLESRAAEDHMPSSLATDKGMPILVCGAHMQGLPLNHQLTELGGYWQFSGKTSSHYRLYALAGEGPLRPALVRDPSSDSAIEIEVWHLPERAVGPFLAQIPFPLGLGKVELEDGEWVSGFICQPEGLQGATEITELGGWRAYLASISTCEPQA